MLTRRHKIAFFSTLLVTGCAVQCLAAGAVTDRDAAAQIAKSACDRALNLPAEDHPRWEAVQVGDHWSARLLSDMAPYPESPLLSVDVAPDGTTSDCIVYVGG